MQRRVEVTVPPEQTDALLQEIRGMEGVLSLRVERGISEHPKGDLISVESLTRTHLDIISLLKRHGIGQSSSSSISISQTSAVISPTVKRALPTETDDSTWEQMQAVISKESNMTAYALTVMLISGVAAAVGITTGALHVVIGAMLIAPGFEPIIRIPLGVAVKSPGWRRGLKDTLLGYFALMLGAFVAALIVATTTASLLRGPSAYMAVEPLISYWTTLSTPSALIALTGGVVGAVLVTTNRSILTAGVMVMLALIPSSTMVGVALAAGDLDLALRSLGRFAAEVGLTLLGSALVWIWLRARVHTRPSML